jgi:hypothetical protein
MAFEDRHGENNYAATANNVGTLAELQTEMDRLVKIADSEEQITIRGLDAEAPLLVSAGTTISAAEESFGAAVTALLAVWTSANESEMYRAASERSRASLATSAEALVGRDGGARVTTLFEGLKNSIKTVATGARDTQKYVEQRIREFWMNPNTGAGVGAGDETAASIGAAAGGAAEMALLAELKPLVAAVGDQLTQLGSQYQEVGRQVQAMAEGVKWDGPRGDMGSTPPGGPTSIPSTAPGGSAGANPQLPGGGPAGESQPGGSPAGQQQPGGGPASDQQPGGGQTGPGGTELTGTTPTLPKPVPLTPLTPIAPLPPLDATPTPPVAPLTPLTPIAATGTARPGGGYPGRAGLGGVGSLGTGGAGGSKLGGLKPIDKLDQQIPSVVKSGTSEGSVSTGRAPSLPGGSGGGAGGVTSAGSGVPPMMPPMGAAGAGGSGGGRGGKPASGAIRPTGRERNRTTGPTPGVPDRLRGKAGKRSAFPAVPAARPTGRRELDRPETLQILDEELWTVDTAPEPTPVKQHLNRRLAN